jgi:hypothetical protein
MTEDQMLPAYEREMLPAYEREVLLDPILFLMVTHRAKSGYSSDIDSMISLI